MTDAMAHYTERHAAHLRSPETARYHAYRIARWLQGRRCSEARAVAAGIVADMRGHYADATINRSLGALKCALRLAWERGAAAIDHSREVKRLAEHNARTTTLTMEQVQRLADHASEQVRAAIWIAIFTGCRRGEVCKIKAEDIGRDIITIQAGNTKTLRTRTVPIIPPLRPWLRLLPLQIDAEGVKSGFRRAREAAGMPEVQYRDLRRSCGTLMVRAGVPLQVISRILGHSATSVTERVYAHLEDGQMRDGLGKLTRLHATMRKRILTP